MGYNRHMTPERKDRHSAERRLSRIVERITGRDHATVKQWAIDLLDIDPTDRILNLRCGPGVMVAEIAQRATSSVVVGVDSSAVMIAQATALNQPAITAGRVKLHLASGKALPYPNGYFTKACVMKTETVWPSTQAEVSELRRLLAPGGRLVILLEERDEHPGLLPLPLRVVMSADQIEAITAALQAAAFAVHSEQRRRMDGHWYRALIATAYVEPSRWAGLIARSAGVALPIAAWVLARRRFMVRKIFQS
jgi:ubiquinone/menaquinone biosynthesis C-methylase UbiE